MMDNYVICYFVLSAPLTWLFAVKKSAQAQLLTSRQQKNDYSSQTTTQCKYLQQTNRQETPQSQQERKLLTSKNVRNHEEEIILRMQNNKMKWVTIRFLAVVQCQCQCQKSDSLGFPAFVVALCRILIAKLQKTAATKRLAKCTETDISDWCGEPGGQTFDIDTDINQSNAGVFWLRCQRFRVLLVCASDRVNVYVVLYEFQHFAFKLFTVLFVLTCLVVFICKKKISLNVLGLSMSWEGRVQKVAFFHSYNFTAN